MAKFRYKHILSTIKDKAPSASTLFEGEIAVNNNAGNERLYIKNSEGEVVAFPVGYSKADIDDDARVLTEALNYLNDNKLDASAYTPTDLSNYYTKSETSGKTELDGAFGNLTDRVDDLSGQSETVAAALVTLNTKLEDAFGNLTDRVDDLSGQSETVAAALVTLNTKKLDASAYTPTDLSNYYTKDEIDDSEEAIANSLNDLNTRIISENTKINTLSGDVSTLNSMVDDLSGQSETVAAALATLNTKKLDASAYTPTDLSNYYTKSETSGSTQLTTAFSNKADVSSLSVYADSVKYNSISKEVEFYHGTTAGTKVFSYDASPFIIDGMVSNVEVKNVTISGESVPCLVISFNTDAGHQDINIPITDIFDADNYYTKDEIDNDSRVVVEALNYLQDNKLDASAYTPTDLSNYYTKNETSGSTQLATAFSNYYTKNETSGKTEISNALGAKVNSATYTAHTADTSIHHSHTNKTYLDAISGNVGSMAYESANDYYNKDEIDDDSRVVVEALNYLQDNKADKSDLDGLKLKRISQSDYDALVSGGTVDANTLYVIN